MLSFVKSLNLVGRLAVEPSVAHTLVAEGLAKAVRLFIPEIIPPSVLLGRESLKLLSGPSAMYE